MSSTSNDSDGRRPSGERVRDAANSGTRVQAVHTGLKKAVTGRESVIKEQAVKLAEKLDAKTEGRHHQKIRLALLALNGLVDTLGRDGKEGSPEGEAPADAARGASDATGDTGKTTPEDLGTFNVRTSKR